MARAAIAGTLQTPDARPDGMSEDEWGQYKQAYRDKDNEAYERAWRNEHQMGMEGAEGKARAINAGMEERAVRGFEAKHTRGEVTAIQQQMFLRPHKYPGVLKLLWDSGERKIQRLVSRLEVHWQVEKFIRDLPNEKAETRYRSVLNTMNNIPIGVIPSCRQRTITTEDFEWIINNRVQKTQPSAEELSDQVCSCGQEVGDGRHFRRCGKQNGMSRLHDSLRDNVINMCQAAGLHTTREPRQLLRDSEHDRPADLFIQNWSVEGLPYRKHAIDLTFPMAESRWDALPTAEKTRRAKRVGATAEARAATKRNEKGTAAEQRERQNSATMTERCRKEHIHFWPAPVEGDGAVSTDFTNFTQNVSDAASRIMGHDRKAFQSRWATTFAVKLAVTSARISLQRNATEYRRISRLPNHSDEFYGEMATDIPVQAGASRSREFRNKMSDLYKSASAGAPPRG
jgi:hypothetical protein